MNKISKTNKMYEINEIYEMNIDLGTFTNEKNNDVETLAKDMISDVETLTNEMIADMETIAKETITMQQKMMSRHGPSMWSWPSQSRSLQMISIAWKKSEGWNKVNEAKMCWIRLTMKIY